MPNRSEALKRFIYAKPHNKGSIFRVDGFEQRLYLFYKETIQNSLSEVKIKDDK